MPGIVTQSTKTVVRLLLDLGTTATGNVRTTPISIGALSPDHYEAEGMEEGDLKAYDIAGALAQCLSMSTHKVERVGTVELDQD